MLKLFENESTLVTGTDSRFWGMPLQSFIELAETREIRDTEMMLQLIHRTIGSGP